MTAPSDLIWAVEAIRNYGTDVTARRPGQRYTAGHAVEALAEPLRLGMKAIEERKRRIEAAELRVERTRKWFNESSHPLAERQLGDAEYELRLLLDTEAKP